MQSLFSALKLIYQWWTHGVVRAWVNQLLILSFVCGTLYVLVQTTAKNLAERGLASGFGFLNNEAGFGIGETPPIPRLEGGFLAFIGTCVLGILLCVFLNLWLKKTKGEKLGASTWSAVVAVFLVVGAPIITLYLYGGDTPVDVYEESSTYRLALKTGVINTLKVSVIGCILTTILGFILGLAWVSTNWLAAKLAEVYVEIFRNIPVLVQIFFWYKGVLGALPSVRESVTWGGIFALNNRGVYMPSPVPTAISGEFGLAIVAGMVGVWFWLRWCRMVQARTGYEPPLFLPVMAFLVVPAALVWWVVGAPFTWEKPVLEGFNYQGGLALSPEYSAMLISLVVYTATYVAEIVRASIQSVSKGQREAANALGLKPGQTMRLVVIPQSMRVATPLLINQYLNLTKNSSLGAAIAYPELVNVGGTVLNTSGQAIEVIAITMAVYLTLSLLISVSLNWYNTRVKLRER